MVLDFATKSIYAMNLSLVYHIVIVSEFGNNSKRSENLLSDEPMFSISSGMICITHCFWCNIGQLHPGYLHKCFWSCLNLDRFNNFRISK